MSAVDFNQLIDVSAEKKHLCRNELKNCPMNLTFVKCRPI